MALGYKRETMTRFRYTPTLNSLCLCGSGKKYKRCCFQEGRIQQLVENENAIRSIREGDYSKALIYIRKAITAYTILHKSHTEPLLATENEGVQWLLDVDTRALSEFISTMLDCYRGIGDYKLFIGSVERLRGNINTPRWQRKITYYQIIGVLGDDWSESVGKREVKKIAPIDEEPDAEIIQLYLHFLGNDISFKYKIDLLDQLLHIVTTPHERLQYTVAKGISYLLVGDEKAAISIIENAISEYKSLPSEDANTYGRYQKARALSLLGDIQKEASLKREALNEFASLLDEKEWMPSGLAMLHSDIAECCFRLGQFQNAIDCYRSSLIHNESELTKIFIAQALGEIDEDESIEIIKSIDARKLDDAGLVDLAFKYAAISIKFKNSDMLKNSIQMLRTIKDIDPIFESQKSQLLQEISEAILHGIDNKNSLKILNTLSTISKKLSRYLILQPNIAGLGLNVNNMLDDIKNRSDKTGD